MASHGESPKDHLSLKQVSKVAGVPARKIQYLRELCVVEPAYIGEGRGDFCWYSVNDVVLVYLCLVDLSELSYDALRSVVAVVQREPTAIYEIPLGSATKLCIDMGHLRSTVQLRINQVVDSAKV